jgi:hypothetical protein
LLYAARRMLICLCGKTKDMQAGVSPNGTWKH